MYNNVPLDDVVAANIGRAQPGGSALTDPVDIPAGWQIVIPGAVTYETTIGRRYAWESDPGTPPAPALTCSPVPPRWR